MSVSITQAANLLVHMVNEYVKGDAFGTISATLKERYNRTELEYYCAATDASIVRWLILNGDGRLKDYLTTSSVAHGADIPTHIGDVDSFYFTITGGQYAGTHPPKITNFARIQADNRNPQATVLSLMAPKMSLMGQKVFHNGAGLVLAGASGVTLTASYPVLTINVASCQSSDEFLRAVVLGAFAMAIQKDGHKSGAAAVAHNMYMAELRAKGISSRPEPVELAQAA